MFSMPISFFRRIYDEDIIYHYTNATTAIDHILHNNQLKFGSARKSFDPIESSNPDRRTVYYNSDSENRDKKHGQDVIELHKFVNDFEERFNQICFCRNKIGSDFGSEDYITNFSGHEELFGFTKLRMWDQYSDKFLGVCIALSKEKLLSLNKKQFDLIEGNVKYLTFQELSTEKIGNIQVDHLAIVGIEKYKQQLLQMVKDSFFYKHNDYDGETEYRIGTLFDKGKCIYEINRGKKYFHNTMMLNISECVEAIFVSSFANQKQKNDLLDYAEKLNVELIEMDWKYDSFECKNYKEVVEFHKSFN